ncbi:MAG: hypothetical protein ABJ327_04225 [Litoreibacter sp.]
MRGIHAAQMVVEVVVEITQLLKLAALCIAHLSKQGVEIDEHHRIVLRDQEGSIVFDANYPHHTAARPVFENHQKLAPVNHRLYLQHGARIVSSFVGDSSVQVIDLIESLNSPMNLHKYI